MDSRKRKIPTLSEKNIEKLERKALIEQEKRKKPGECLKVWRDPRENFPPLLLSLLLLQYVKTIIDRDLLNDPISSRIVPNLTALGVQYEVKSQYVPRVISWQRSLVQTLSTSETVSSLESLQNSHQLRAIPAPIDGEIPRRIAIAVRNHRGGIEQFDSKGGIAVKN